MPKSNSIPTEVFKTVYSADSIEKKILRAIRSDTVKELSKELSSMLIELRVINERAESDIKRVLREEETLCEICKYDNASFCRGNYSYGWHKCHAEWRGCKDNEDK